MPKTSGAGKADVHMQKSEIKLVSTMFQKKKKTNCKWVKDLNFNPGILKLLEENMPYMI